MNTCRFASVPALATGVALAAVGCAGESIGDTAATGGTGDMGSGSDGGTTGGGTGSRSPASGAGGTAMGGSSAMGEAAASGDERANPWSGKKYFLSMMGEWTVPRGIGRDIDYFVPSFMLAVSGDTLADASMIIGASAPDATALDAVQNLCAPTQVVAFDASAYPKSEVAPAAMRVHIKNSPSGGDPVQTTGSVYGFTMTDVLPNVGSTTSAGRFQGMMDFRELYRLFTALGPTVSPDGVCESLKDQFTPLGCETDPTCWVACGPCPNDGEPYCLTVEAEDVGAVEAPNLDIVEVAEASRPVTCADP